MDRVTFKDREFILTGFDITDNIKVTVANDEITVEAFDKNGKRIELDFDAEQGEVIVYKYFPGK